MENGDELEIYTMTDEDGNDITVQAIDYFYYNGDEYAVMTELAEGQEPWTELGGDEEAPEIFFMKVEQVDEENAEFIPVDEDLSEELFEVYSAGLEEMDEDDEDGEE